MNRVVHPVGHIPRTAPVAPALGPCSVGGIKKPQGFSAHWFGKACVAASAKPADGPGSQGDYRFQVRIAGMANTPSSAC
jgi:hypothetical protein